MISAISDVRVSTLSSDKHSSFGLESEPISTSVFSLLSELVLLFPPQVESNKNRIKKIENFFSLFYCTKNIQDS